MTRAALAYAKSADVFLGDIKFDVRTADHDGWYRLNGRAVNTLPAFARISAAALGLGASIPNAVDRLLRRAGGALGSVGGSNSHTITRQQLPARTYTGNTPAGQGAHDHDVTNPLAHQIGNANPRGGAPLNIPSTKVNMAVQPADNVHDHNVTMSSGGGGQPLDITQRFISARAFIYLGE